jgi:NADH-quinone oxidoreductase subunit H
MSGAAWLHTVIGLIALLILLAGVTLVGVWWERKFIGHLQRRHGPLHHGFHGLLQLPADMIKMVGKEDTVPAAADHLLFQFGPIAAIVPAYAALAALAFWPNGALINMSHGLLYIFAFETFLPLSFALIGWSCANKYTLIGGLRAAAQLISYEIPMLLAALGVVLTAQSMNLTTIINAQTGVWYIVKQPLGFVIFSIAMLAEMNRSPFDLPEAESELVAGYMTEYSGMKFGFVQLAEYSVLLVGSYLISALYLGGWNMPFLPASWIWLALKIVILMTSTMWFRGTFPRLRVDTLTQLSWKWLLPAALVNIMLVAGLALALGPKIY